MFYLKDITCWIFVVFSIFLFFNGTISPEIQLLLIAQGQQGQENASATDMLNLRNSIIPQAKEVNEANTELINICTDSPNPECDDTMIIIYNDCVAYPAFVATHIPSCGDSRLFSYLIARELVD